MTVRSYSYGVNRDDWGESLPHSIRIFPSRRIRL